MFFASIDAEKVSKVMNIIISNEFYKCDDKEALL